MPLYKVTDSLGESITYERKSMTAAKATAAVWVYHMKIDREGDKVIDLKLERIEPVVRETKHLRIDTTTGKFVATNTEAPTENKKQCTRQQSFKR